MNDGGSLEEEKSRLRKGLREKLEKLKPEERRKRSQEILARLFDHPRFLEARSLLTYIARDSEVETRPILDEARKKGKRVYIPRVDAVKRQIEIIEAADLALLKPGAHGILEPPFDKGRVGRPGDLDLVIVPGLGFDREGGRLGRGEGYFDRFLKEARQAYKIGLAFACQILDRIPRVPHDILMDEILAA